MRNDPRRRAPRLVLLRARGQRSRRCPPLPACARRLRGASPCAGLPGRCARSRPTSSTTAPRSATTARCGRSERRRATGVEAIASLIAGRAAPTWTGARGFLAGIFDAEGGCSRGILRISNTDDEIIDWTAWCLRRFGFAYVIEDRQRANGIRDRPTSAAGSREHLRFFHTVDPGITRKRSIEGKRNQVPKPNLQRRIDRSRSGEMRALRHHHGHR